MKELRWLIFSLLMFLIGCRLAADDVEVSTKRLANSAEIDPTLASTLEAIPNSAEAGIMVGLIDGDQEQLAVVGNPAFDENTLFEFGSITKVLTGITLGQLIDEGELNADAAVNTLLPDDLRNEKWDAVTVQQVAAHGAGLPGMPDNYMSPRLFLSGGNPVSYSDEKLATAMAEVELGAIGEQFAYSNFGFAILGQVIRAKTGMPYADVIQARVFEPYGMATATIHGWAGDDVAPPLRGSGASAGNWDFDAMASAGAARGSLLDGMALLRASMAACADDADGALRGNCIAQQSRLPLGDRTTGLAWIVEGDGTLWHNGGTGGYRTFLGFNSAENRGIVLLSNNGQTEGLEAAAFDWLTRYANETE